ncbi:MAG: hypothetical protein V1672_03595 [Candidatus Diapherotrites archaeon]
MRVEISKDELEDRYVRQKLPMSKLAKKLGCTPNTISYWMNLYGIKSRTTSEAVKLFVKDKKIKLPKKELFDLYVKKKQSPSKIAKKYNCEICTILNRLREYKIKIRSSSKINVKITKSQLKLFYEKEKLTTYEIAEKFNCCQASIWKRLKQFGIKTRTSHSLNSNVPKKQDLIKLYVNKGLSTWAIEKQFGFSRSTVYRKLKAYGLEPRTMASSHIVHLRQDFSGDLIEKAYLIGFRVGDLRVRKMYKNSETISVECGSTKEEQLELIKALFQKYAPVWITKENKIGARNIGVNLPLTFSFLLDKVAADWVFENEKHFFSFLAGFTDAEGHIGILNDKAIYSLGNYDEELLRKIRKTLFKHGIECRKLFISAKKGYVTHEGYVHNGDYWVLQINRKLYLLKLFQSLKSYIKHSAKIKALNGAVENITERNRKFGNINMSLSPHHILT